MTIKFCSLLLFLVVTYVHGIPVSVMLPLNTVSNNGQLNNPTQLLANFQQLQSGGVNGVMTDVWWGIVESAGPQQYNWAPYLQLAQLVAKANLTLQVVMSFHQCGTNVGDACYIPLPQWVLDVGQSNPNIFFKDAQGNTDSEYLSFGVDDQPLFQGRTAVQIYSDYMQSFAQNFAPYMPNVLNQVQVGMGPAGELRYPGYQLQDNRWTYCGIGEFQCYDSYLLASLANAAQQAGHPEWGHGGPDDAGTYDSYPYQTGFFSDNTYNNYASDYGQFFLGWYSQTLLAHGSAILSAAQSAFSSHGISIAAKVAGIHWWYNSDNHAAECTAGYYNTNQQNFYLQAAQMMKQYNAEFDFTCLEMVDSDPSCDSGPQELVTQAIQASQNAGVAFAGENALPCCQPSCNPSAFNEIYYKSTQFGPIARFTYLRLNPGLISGSNWQFFQTFVQRMANAF